MAYKFEINTLYLTVTDTVSGDILLNEVRSDIKWGLDSEDCYLIYFKSALPNGQEQSLFKVGENSFDFADIVDSTGVAFASETAFRNFLYSNIGHISGEIGTSVEYLDFSLTPSVNAIPGRLVWNPDDNTLELGLTDDVVLQLGQEQFLYATNKQGTTITDAQAVYVFGATGSKPTVKLAKADAYATSNATIGIVTQPEILNNGTGFICTSGLVHNLDTSAFTEGVELWLSETVAGEITETKPEAPFHSVRIGYCVRSHATQGMILVSVLNGFQLDDLHDVKATNAMDRDIIVFNEALGYWENEPTLSGSTLFLFTNFK